MNRVLILAFLVVTGCVQSLSGTPSGGLTLDQKAQRFLQRLYPGEEFNIVCDDTCYVNGRYHCAAVRRSYLTLPPIAFFCAPDESPTTCHLAGEER